MRAPGESGKPRRNTRLRTSPGTNHLQRLACGIQRLQRLLTRLSTRHHGPPTLSTRPQAHQRQLVHGHAANVSCTNRRCPDLRMIATGA
ncbi:MAG: hypothetical protein AABZ08_08080 [Planctomycetota bacterium]